MVAAGKSLRSVAQAMHLSQPALSARMQRLEQQLGFAMFVRDGPRLQLSAQGRRFLPYLQRQLLDVDGLLRAAARIRDHERDVWRLGWTPLAALSCGVAMAELVRSLHPQADLVLAEHTSDVLEQMLADDRIDLALLHPPIDRAGLEWTLLFEQPYGVALRADDPLAARPQVEPASLADRELVFVAREVGPALHARLVNLCRDAGFEPRIAWTLPTSLTLADHVARFRCVGFALAAATRLAGPDVVFRPLAGTAPRLGFALGRRSGGALPLFDALTAQYAQRAQPPADGDDPDGAAYSGASQPQ